MFVLSISIQAGDSIMSTEYIWLYLLGYSSYVFLCGSTVAILTTFDGCWDLLRFCQHSLMTLSEKAWRIWKVDRHIKKTAELVWTPNSSAVQSVKPYTPSLEGKSDLDMTLFFRFTQKQEVLKHPETDLQHLRQCSDLNENLFSWLMATSHFLVSVFCENKAICLKVLIVLQIWLYCTPPNASVVMFWFWLLPDSPNKSVESARKGQCLDLALNAYQVLPFFFFFN